MPSRSQKQHDLMKRVAVDPELSKKLDIPQDVAKEFVDADKELGLWEGAERSERLPKEPGYLEDW